MRTPYLVVGLGNPPEIYRATRHNVGMTFVEFWVQKEGLVFQPGRGEFEWAQKDPWIWVRPRTYMNLSGIAVRQALDAFDLDHDHLLVVVDDAQLPFGTLRLRTRGSSGGHRGLESVIYHLATEDFARLRIGIGAPPPEVPLRDYVLAPFLPEEQEALPALFQRALEGLEILKNEGIQKAMAWMNRRKTA